MDAIELRLMFVGGLLVLGGVALLAAAALARMKEWVQLHGKATPGTLAGPMQTSPARHRAVTGHTYGGRRS